MEMLKEVCNILLGHEIIVHTDHKNLTCKNFNTECVMRWHLILEEYGPKLLYIKGEHNIVADALSCLDMSPATEVQEQYSLDQMAECFTGEDNEMLFPTTTYPLLYKYVAYAQARDAKLQADRAT